MTTSFDIKFTITGVNCDLLRHSEAISALDLQNEMVTGDAELIVGDQTIRLENCGLLGLAVSLRWLCLYPILYGLPANDMAHDDAIAFRAQYTTPHLCLTISDLESGRTHELQLNPVEFLQSVGAQYRKALTVMFEQCPEIQHHRKLLASLPDASNLLSAGLGSTQSN